MRNWYKIAKDEKPEVQSIHSMEDRNRVNAKIRHLEALVSVLDRAADLAFQTQRGARGMVQRVLADKRLSSYPSIKGVLVEADEIAMDSPPRFIEVCRAGIIEIEMKIAALKAERKRFVDEELGLPRKGLS
tara:strand:+ start:440195 stop:440587 length:393 start_codon:yes stop_codon:yes gene_type:complete